MSKKMKQNIVDEYGTTYTADGFFNIDFEVDILYGLNDARVAAASCMFSKAMLMICICRRKTSEPSACRRSCGGVYR